MMVLSQHSATALLLFQLLAISWIDASRMIIPNALNLMLALTGISVSYCVLQVDILWLIASALAVYIVFSSLSHAYATLRGRQGLGSGDIKFLGAATFWVGLLGLPWTLLIASISGLCLIVISGLLGKPFTVETRLPFGPHLSLGLFATWLMRDTLG